MTLVTSGTISLTDIQTEFGGASPTSINEYYAGTYTGSIGVVGGVIYAGATGTTATASYRISTDGKDYQGVNGTFTALNTFLTAGTYVPGGTYGTNGYVPSSGQVSFSNFYGTTTTSQPGTANYEVMCTVLGGTLSIGSSTTGTWLPVTSDLTWQRNRATIGINTTDIQIDVRHKDVPGTIISSTTLQLQAERY